MHGPSFKLFKVLISKVMTVVSSGSLIGIECKYVFAMFFNRIGYSVELQNFLFVHFVFYRYFLKNNNNWATILILHDVVVFHELK